jgi:hypothetical protein
MRLGPNDPGGYFLSSCDVTDAPTVTTGKPMILFEPNGLIQYFQPGVKPGDPGVIYQLEGIAKD